MKIIRTPYYPWLLKFLFRAPEKTSTLEKSPFFYRLLFRSGRQTFRRRKRKKEMALRARTQQQACWLAFAAWNECIKYIQCRETNILLLREKSFLENTKDPWKINGASSPLWCAAELCCVSFLSASHFYVEIREEINFPVGIGSLEGGLVERKDESTWWSSPPP